MADFFNDIGDALSQAYQAKADSYSQMFNNPGQYAMNRFRNDLGLPSQTNTSTQAAQVTAPAVPETEPAPSVVATPHPVQEQPEVAATNLPPQGPAVPQQQPARPLSVAQPGQVNLANSNYLMNGAANPANPPQEQAQATPPQATAQGGMPNAMAQAPTPEQQAVPRPQQAPLVVNASNPAQTSDPTFNSLQQVESNGQHFNPDGTIKTSKVGAQGIAQIMPATAANPGFGVAPISQEDLKDPVKNATFGLKLFTGLKKYYNGDEEKAVAAYNAGAGNVNKAVQRAAKEGGDWKDYLPDETKAYLPKVMAGKKPLEGAVADHLESQGYDTNAISGTGIKYPDGSTPAHFAALDSNDHQQLSKLATDLSTPPAVAREAYQRIFDYTKNKVEEDKAKQEVDQKLANGQNPWPQGRQANTDQGSYLKAYIFARLGLNDLAAQEQEKISPTKQTMPVMLGNDHYQATYNKSGELLYARDENGNLVNNATLSKLAANAFASKGAKTEAGMIQAPNGDAYSKTVVPGRAGFVWRNEKTGDISDKMPEGAVPFGQINPQTKANIALATSAKRMMINQNVKDRAAGLTPSYSEEDIDNIATHVSNGGAMPAKLAASMGEGTTPAPAAAPTPAAANATTQPIQGTAASRLSPALEAQAQAIYKGEQPMPTGLGASNLTNRALSNRVQELAAQEGKPFDPTVYHKMKKTEDEFNTGKLGTAVKSMNVAIDHLDTLQEAATALHNGNMPLFNKIANLYATNTGAVAPGSFDAVKTIVGSEVAKAIAGGATALGDREEIRKELDNAKNPQQLAGVIDKYQHLLAGQVNGLHQQYTSGHGRQTEWDTKLTDRTKTVLTGKQAPATPAPYGDADKEARYQEYLKKRNAGK